MITVAKKRLLVLTGILFSILLSSAYLSSNRPNLSLIFVLIVALSQLALGLFILIKDPKNEINRSFFLVSLTLVSWNLLAGQVTQPGRNDGLILSDRMIFLPATLMSALFLDFCLIFPKRIFNYRSTHRYIIFFFSAVILSIIPFDLIIKTIETRNDAITPVFGAFYPLFVLYSIIYVVLSFVVLAIKYFFFSGYEKKQVLYLFIGFMALCFGLIITNLLLLWAGN